MVPAPDKGTMMALILAQAITRISALDSGSATEPRAPRSGGLHLTGASVRRGSVEAGTVEDNFFAVPAKGTGERMVENVR